REPCASVSLPHWASARWALLTRALKREDQPARTAPPRPPLVSGHRLPHPCWTATQPACTGGCRHIGQHIADRDRRATSLGSLECLQAAGRATRRLPPRRPDPHPPCTSVRRSSRWPWRRALGFRRTGPAVHRVVQLPPGT